MVVIDCSTDGFVAQICFFFASFKFDLGLIICTSPGIQEKFSFVFDSFMCYDISFEFHL